MNHLMTQGENMATKRRSSGGDDGLKRGLLLGFGGGSVVVGIVLGLVFLLRSPDTSATSNPTTPESPTPALTTETSLAESRGSSSSSPVATAPSPVSTGDVASAPLTNGERFESPTLKKVLIEILTERSVETLGSPKQIATSPEEAELMLTQMMNGGPPNAQEFLFVTAAEEAEYAAGRMDEAACNQRLDDAIQAASDIGVELSELVQVVRTKDLKGIDREAVFRFAAAITYVKIKQSMT